MAQIPPGFPNQNNPAIQPAGKIVQHASIGTVSEKKVPGDGFAGIHGAMTPVDMASHKPLTESHTVSKKTIEPVVHVVRSS